MTYRLKFSTRSLLVPWAYMPTSWGYKEITEDDMDEWNRKAFKDLQLLIPDVVAVRPIMKNTIAVFAVRRQILEEVRP